MITAALLNNYSMSDALARHAEGTYPGQHLWGAVPHRPDLEWEVHHGLFDLDRLRRGWGSRIRSMILRVIGDPFQQGWVLARHRRTDIVFAADQWTGGLIGALSHLRISRKPYVVLVHHLPSSRWNAFCLKGATHITALSPYVARRLVEAGIADQDRLTILKWGPDLAWPGYARETRTYDFVAAGRTNRDYEPLRDAARKFRLNGLILDGRTRSEFVDGEELRAPSGILPYTQLAHLIARARCVVIPIRDRHKLTGLTEMADAAAVGTPIVVTRSDFAFWDLEGTKSGIHLEGNTSEEIGRAINFVQHHDLDSSVLAAMYNTVEFSEQLADIFRMLLRTNPPK